MSYTRNVVYNEIIVPKMNILRKYEKYSISSHFLITSIFFLNYWKQLFGKMEMICKQNLISDVEPCVLIL